MGVGASASLDAAAQATSEADLQAALAGMSAEGRGKVLTALGQSSAGLERGAAEEGEAATNTVQIYVDFMGGEVVTVSLGRIAEMFIRDLKQGVTEQKNKPSGSALKLVWDGRELKNSEVCGPLAGAHVQGVWVKSETSYLVDVSGATVLLDDGDDGWSEETAGKAQVDESQWVPPPTEGNGPAARNLARHSEGVTIKVSSCLWGNPVDNQKVLNVLRLGSKYGEPRWMGRDNGFIFKENDMDQQMELDFGGSVTLVRVGTMCYRDRWLNQFAVETSADEEGDGAWVAWGRSDTAMHGGGEIHFDREPTPTRRIRMRCRSGHYYGAGARLGPIFAWGWHD